MVMFNSSKYWVRTCQECGNEQKDNKPDSEQELSDSYRNRKCKKCKSESLDYGTWVSKENE